jgi:PKD repeat protein
MTLLPATLILLIVSSVASAAPVYYSANNHYYEKVDVVGGISWIDANATAQSSTYLGAKGHLATISSQEENSFIVSSLDANDNWLGGIQTDRSHEPAGGWQWVTGEPWVYVNWGEGEPSNRYAGAGLPLGTPEDYLQLGGAGKWNDLPNAYLVGGYIIEYEPDNTPTPILPIADFTANGTEGITPLAVKFTDNSSYATERSWDFGDGSTSAQQNPTHTYMGTGQFTVKLTVWSTYGSSGIQRNNYISTLGAITFNGYCLDYTSSLAIDGATIKIIDSGGATVGTTTSTALGYYSITVNAPFSSIYALEGSKTDYQTVTYTGLLYPIIFTNGVLSQDVYFFAVNTFPTPGPTTPAGTTDSNTLSSGDKQAAITASVDYWANGILLLAVLLFIGIIMAIFGRMTG